MKTKNTLWQYLDKEHLDTDNELLQKQWNDFVKQYESRFADECSIIGQDLFYEFINKPQVNERNKCQ